VEVDAFLQLTEALTGTPVEDVTDTDRACLATILADDGRALRSSQFNELLLLVNKDRVGDCFFRHFFGDDCKIGMIPAGVRRFQTAAMLCFGNFIQAFRRLSRARSAPGPLPGSFPGSGRCCLRGVPD
jgi:hypothetical protein